MDSRVQVHLDVVGTLESPLAVKTPEVGFGLMLLDSVLCWLGQVAEVAQILVVIGQTHVLLRTRLSSERVWARITAEGGRRVLLVGERVHVLLSGVP